MSPCGDSVAPFHELPIKGTSRRLLPLNLRVCCACDEETFDQSLSETRVLCLTKGVQSSKMENFFIPSSQINEVKQKNNEEGKENFSLRCSLKLYFFVPLLRKDAQNQPKEWETLNWFEFKWTPENFSWQILFNFENVLESLVMILGKSREWCTVEGRRGKESFLKKFQRQIWFEKVIGEGWRRLKITLWSSKAVICVSTLHAAS